jgi:hypothetical protein
MVETCNQGEFLSQCCIFKNLSYQPCCYEDQSFFIPPAS